MELQDRAALITGGKRIGAAIAADLARRGMHVALSYNRSKREAEDAADAVRTARRQVLVIQAELSKAEECRPLVNQSASTLGRLNVLVNIASAYTTVPFEYTDETHWD